MPPRAPRSRRLPTTISEAQFLTLLEHVSATSASGLRNAAVLLVMYDAGLRVGEVCGLAPGDVNRRDGIVRVREGERGRVVPLTRRTRGAIAAWEGVRGRGGTHLFCTLSERRRLSDRYVRAMLARYATRAGVFKITRTGGENGETPINPHVLRHSFAARALARGIDVHDLQRLL